MSELTVGTLSGLAANSYVIDVASGSQLTQPGMPLQVVSTTKTDTFTTTSSSFGDITSLSVAITPSSTLSKIMVIVNLLVGSTTATGAQVKLLRDSTDIAIGDASGSRTRVTSSTYSSSAGEPLSVSFSNLDSPASTSALTYKVQLRSTVGGETSAINRSATDSDSALSPRGVSTITVMEIAG